MIPSSVLPMIASSEDSTIAATRASAASVRACALTFAARSSVIIAIVPMNAWSSSNDSFGVYEDLQAVREPPHEEGAEEPLERVATGDAERRPDRPRRRDVHQERAQEQGGPDAIAQQQRRGQRDARRRPHRRRARVDERERQPELPGEEVDPGEHEEAPRYERNSGWRHPYQL